MMKFANKEFVPVLFGGDINTYSVARAFYEEYGVKSYIFGKYKNGPCYNSKITEYTADADIEKDEVFIFYVNKTADAFPGKKIMLIGCGDAYVALASRNREAFRDSVTVPYIGFELMDRLQNKESFYELAQKHGIDIPSTFVYTRDMKHDFDIPYEYPVILKPANGIMYWENPFASQKKIYKIGCREELDRVIDDIYGAGYADSLIIQDMIPGNDEYMYVLTAYSDRNGKVRMMCLGHVLLEEHTPHGLGNHAVIVTEYVSELTEKVKNLLEELNYRGFSNFDIKYDSRDGRYKFFEINTRQGRSNYYVTGSGLNIAKYLVEDCIYGIDDEAGIDNAGKDHEPDIAKEEHLWLVVPAKVACDYVKNPENREKIRRNMKSGNYVNPVFMKGDFRLSRFLRLVKQHISHGRKFKTYYR